MVTSIAVSIFLSAGFISVSIIWFFAISLYNVRSPSTWQRKSLNPLILPILLFALNLPWIFLSADQPETVDLVTRKIHLLLIPAGFILIDKHISDRAFNFILTLFLVCSLLFSLLCLGGAFIQFLKSEAGEGTNRFTGFALSEVVNISPVYLSMFLNMAFVITLQNHFVGFKAKLAIGLYLATLILLLSSLPGILTLTVTSFLWMQSTTTKTWISLVTAGLLIVALTLVFIFYVPSQTLDPNDSKTETVKSIADRLIIWSYAMKTGNENPVTGHGSGMGQTALEQTYEREGFLRGAKASLNPHNQFLSTYLDLGLVGVLVLALVLLYPFVWSLRSGDFLLMTFIVMMILFFSFESVLVRQKGIVFFSYFYALIFSNSLRPASQD